MTALTSRPLKVAILCQSDSLGGAAVVTRRLAHTLHSENIDAHLLVFHKLSSDPLVFPTTSRIHRAFTFMGERLGIFLRNGFSRSNLFKVSTASTGLDLCNHPTVREADVILLSWINQGFLSLRSIRKLASLGKPIVWMMHDMWNVTGICHHAYECTAYTGECGRCPFLTGHRPHDLAYRTQRRKALLYAGGNFTFVAVSHWLAECARKSYLMREADVRVIPNAFPIEAFPTEPTMQLPFLNDKKYVIVMGAARLDDPIKGLPFAIEALNYLFDNHPVFARQSIAVFFGSVKSPTAFDTLHFPHYLTGQVNDSNTLRQLYASADVVLSTSHYETLPGTLIEGMAAGAVPVSFDHGGQSDIFEHLSTGYMAKYHDTVDVAKGILWAATQRPASRRQLHEEIHRKFASKVVAAEYIKLFHSLLQK